MNDHCKYCNCLNCGAHDPRCIGKQLEILFNDEDGFPARFLEKLKDIDKTLGEISSHLKFIADESRKL